jgi:hypothetical protein
MTGKPSFYPIYPEDLKYKTWNDVTKPESKACQPGFPDIIELDIGMDDIVPFLLLQIRQL